MRTDEPGRHYQQFGSLEKTGVASRQSLSGRPYGREFDAPVIALVESRLNRCHQHSALVGLVGYPAPRTLDLSGRVTTQQGRPQTKVVQDLLGKVGRRRRAQFRQRRCVESFALVLVKAF